MTPSQVLINALRDRSYAPYCMRCSTITRMTQMAHLQWRCRCGGTHDARPELEAWLQSAGWPRNGYTSLPHSELTLADARLLLAEAVTELEVGYTLLVKHTNGRDEADYQRTYGLRKLALKLREALQQDGAP